jgi:hypothetical protein
VEAHARLVEHVEHADERGADLRREPDALPLAGGERLRAAVEGQVVEPHVDEEAEPRGHGLQQRLGDGPLPWAERSCRPGSRCSLFPQALDERAHMTQAACADLRDVLSAELHGERFGRSRLPLQASHVRVTRNRPSSSSAIPPSLASGSSSSLGSTRESASSTRRCWSRGTTPSYPLGRAPSFFRRSRPCEVTVAPPVLSRHGERGRSEQDRLR